MFKVFKEYPTEIPGLAQCTYDQTTEGEFVIGTTRVPILPARADDHAQGGNIKTGRTSRTSKTEYFALPAKNGESLSKTELNVPGGLSDFIDCTKISEPLLRAACRGILL